jgi:hypothetical protein
MSSSSTPEVTAESAFVCDCAGPLPSACNGEPFYKEHDGKRYCVLHFPGNEKSVAFKKALERKLGGKDFNFRGIWFPDKLQFFNFRFDTIADFSDTTFNAQVNFFSTLFAAEVFFNHAVFNKVANFHSAIFCAEVFFCSATFRAAAEFGNALFKARVDFISAIFDSRADLNANFNSEAFFSYADFSAEANFGSAKFHAEANFFSTSFNANANFINTDFNLAASFGEATFNAEALFDYAIFRTRSDFSHAIFKDYVRFAGEEHRLVFSSTSSLDLQFARIEKLDRVSFHTLTLRPHWFVNVDARKFDFINVKWDWQPTINEEIEALKSKDVSEPHRLLSIACRQLAVNAEENHRYDEASKFRYWSMYARQQETWSGLAFWWRFRNWLSTRWSHVSRLPILRFFNRNWLYWFYWAASGYGERIFRAFIVLLGVWLFSALLYTQVGFARWETKLTSESDVATARRDEVGAPLGLSRALTYSFGVMTFQKPEPRPTTTAAQIFVILETIFGPLQAALLALAIRRKFMR